MGSRRRIPILLALATLMLAVATHAAEAQSLRRQRAICFGRDSAPVVVIEACTATITGGIAGSEADLAYAYGIRAGAYWSEGQLDLAMAGYDRAIELAPDYPPFRINRGALRRSLGRYAEAIEDFDVAIRFERDVPEAFSGRGLARVADDDRTGALADFEQALRLDPQHAHAHLGLGRVHQLAGDHERAQAEFDEAVRLRPRNGEIRHAACWGRAAFLNRDLDHALADCDAAVSLAPNYYRTFETRAFVRMRRSEFAAASADYSAALALEPRAATSLYGRGVARLRSGETAEGRADIEAAVAMRPDVAASLADYGMAP